ncbi:MAG: TIGR01906 family membrane protein [Christensenella sp.]|uniref:TIGR01906 family membrane protein n=1 Tax=Christensenella sp. TaxID=1935934 RepID=UPI002B21A6F9|nr:TIGR01906 family membrane protein [Christensenella sp.]MEA5003414.1 TIGR01906 family membrane protein [Christensenella sp.]
MAESKRSVSTLIFAVIATILIVFSVVVACVQGFAFDSAFYKQEYASLGTAAKLDAAGAANIDLATDQLLGYLQGQEESLDLVMGTDDWGQEYYNDREKAHMIDVKALYQNALTFMVAGFCVGGALLMYCMLHKKRAYLKQTLRVYFFTTVGILVFFVCIGIWAAVDFNNFWISFHHVFFTNDLWILDPQTSRMIIMFEEQLFADLVARILATFLAIVVGAAAAAGIINKRMAKHG